MPSNSSVPPIEFSDDGIVLPSELSILDAVQHDIDIAFGGGLSFNLETPQGQLASSLSAVIADKNNEIAYLINQMDPRYSSGRFQDGFARLYFLERKPATSTAVTATLTGIPFVVIPVGALAQDTSGNQYALVGAVTIGSGGTVEGIFQNVLPGPIPCAPNTLIRIYQSFPGWDAINNDAEGVLGRDVESPTDFEFRRKNSVSINGHGSLPAIYSSVYAVPNVLDVYATENATGAVVSMGSNGYSLKANSLYIAVVGGTDEDVAKAIWLKKNLGCNMNGNTFATVFDTSGYQTPFPQYTVQFQRPSVVPIYFHVEIVNSVNLPSDIGVQVQSAILGRFIGADGFSRERIGGTVYASRYYGAVSLIMDNLGLLTITVGLDAVGAVLDTLPIGIDEVPTLNTSNIEVTLI